MDSPGKKDGNEKRTFENGNVLKGLSGNMLSPYALGLRKCSLGDKKMETGACPSAINELSLPTEVCV